MRVKKFLSTVLALALAAGMVLPAGAASSSFTDVSDAKTAVNADILRLMGVVSGVGGGHFDPGAGLTRAEFCTMMVKFMQKGDDVPIHTTRTIFSDVTAKHWALGYVNLAASLTVKDGERETALVSGVGDGTFQPDAAVTMAQACTVLLRVLGYTSKQTGSVWPQSYMDLAGTIGLTDGVSAGTGDPITRAQAAQLFVNALRCETGAGGAYYKTLGAGTPTEGVIILAVGVETDDGSSNGAIRTSNNKEAEAYLAAAGEVEPAALVGKRGALVLNDKEEIVTFVPDDTVSTTITLSGGAQPGYVKGTNGRQYTMSKDTLLYTASSKGGTAWSEGYAGLYSGTQITMYTQRGKIVAVYAGSGASGDATDAVVVQGRVGTADFHQLTGGVTGFEIRKNRQSISMGQIQPYDVVTYDSLSNTLIVSDLRLACVYEEASPNAKAPTEIKALGCSFPVLDSAWETVKDFSLGSQVVLLLTADGAVAGMASPSGTLRSTAVGLASSGGATLFLPSGGELKLSGEVPNADKIADQLVTLSSTKRGTISASRLAEQQSSGEFDVDSMKLGSRTVTAGVRIFEQVDKSAMVQVELSHLNMSKIPSDKIYSYRENSSGMVDYIVLDPVTGDAYTYGLMTQRSASSGGEGSSQAWSLERGSGRTDFTSLSGYSGKNNSFAGVVSGQGLDGSSTVIRASVELTKVTGASPSDFFESQGIGYVTVGGRTYQVANDVECCYRAGEDRGYSWLTQSSGEDRVNACKALSDRLTLYVDPVGSRVRIIEAN